jgi:hypothetical protein
MPSDIVWDDIHHKEDHYKICFKRVLKYISLLLISALVILYDYEFKHAGPYGVKMLREYFSSFVVAILGYLILPYFLNRITEQSCKYQNKSKRYRDNLLKHVLLNFSFFIIMPLILFSILYVMKLNIEGMDNQMQR